QRDRHQPSGHRQEMPGDVPAEHSIAGEQYSAESTDGDCDSAGVVPALPCGVVCVASGRYEARGDPADEAGDRGAEYRRVLAGPAKHKELPCRATRREERERRSESLPTRLSRHAKYEGRKG